ncbi:MAG: GNAT family N-acetyltransferase [Bacteroidales bacterium]
MMELRKYEQGLKGSWDLFVKESKNGTFLFLRDYMDYHSDRFEDCSYLVFNKDRIEALIPGNINGSTFYSHQGLTYGGLIQSGDLKTSEVLEIFKELNNILVATGIDDVIIKPVPYIYHKIPAQEEIYALFINNAVKIACFISTTIIQSNKIRFSELRRRGVKKALKSGFTVEESANYEFFWPILNENLGARYSTSSVHTLSEIKKLGEIFPDNIKLYIVRSGEEILGGTVLYLSPNIVHVQYIAAGEKGKREGALDLLFDTLVNNIYLHIPVFDFGHSTTNGGRELNEGLIFQKEGFGGRGVVYDTYKYSIRNAM